MLRTISVLFAVLGIGLASCRQEPPQFIENVNSGAALGTSYNIIYLSDTKLNFQKGIDSVFQAINRSLSTYIPNSAISKINQGDSTLVVDQMFRDVFELSKEVSQKTNGYFDPTVGALVNAWGFGPERQIKMDSAKVDSLMELVGFDKVSISTENTILKSNPNIYIDFNAIAKGYAIDRLAILLDRKGIQNYLLEVGGELVAKGVSQIKKKPWIVGIDDPQIEEGRRLKITVQLKDRALASSGNYRKFRVDLATGKKFVHTVDPKTGFTKNANTLGVTIIANTCAEADAYATAIMAMDLVDSIKLLTRQRGLDAYVIYLNEKGESQEFMTDGFRKLLID